MNLKYVFYELNDEWTDGVFVTEETVENAIQNIKSMYRDEVSYIIVYDTEIKGGYLCEVSETGKTVYEN